MALLKQQLVRGCFGESRCVFETVLDFLTGDPNTPGRDWTIHADYRLLEPPYRFDRVVLRNTGKSDNEEIFVGIHAVVHSAGVEAGLIFRVYYSFDNTIKYDGNGVGYFATSWLNTTYGSALGDYTGKNYIPFRTDESTEIWENKPALELWVYSNKARIIIIVNTEERYANAYIGQYIRHVTPGEVPYPLCILSDSFNQHSSGGENLYGGYLGYTTVDWNSGESGWNFHRRNLIFSRHGEWSFSTNTRATDERDFACNRFMGPLGWTYDWYMDPTQPPSTGIVTGTHINYPDGGYELMLFPIYIYAYTASQADLYLLGQLDGVYWAPNQSNSILSEMDDGSTIIFPDINRTYWHSWMAIKDEE